MTEEIFFEAGKRIAQLRGKLTQAGFAQRLSVSRKTVEVWESGVGLPNGASLLRMREALGADINVILTGHAGGVAPALRPDEDELLANYRQANSDGRERIRQISATAANSPKREKKAPSTDMSHHTQIASTRGAVQIIGSGNSVQTHPKK